jgi:hypothetical protein
LLPALSRIPVRHLLMMMVLLPSPTGPPNRARSDLNIAKLEIPRRRVKVRRPRSMPQSLLSMLKLQNLLQESSDSSLMFSTHHS